MILLFSENDCAAIIFGKLKEADFFWSRCIEVRRDRARDSAPESTGSAMEVPRCSATKVQERDGWMGVCVVGYLIHQERQDAQSLVLDAADTRA